MEMPDELQTVYSATIEEQDGDYYLSVPAREVETGAVEPGEPIRVALLARSTPTAPSDDSAEPPNPATDPPEPAPKPAESTDPPVAEGETREVKIESIGDQGDGIAKVDRGYVVIVPETDLGETVTVEIENVRDNVSFATVVDRNVHQA